MDRVVMGERALAGDGFDHGNAALCSEIGKALFRQRITHAAAGNDERTFRLRQQPGGSRHGVTVRTRPRNFPDLRFKEDCRIIESDFLRILRKTDKGRAAIGRIEHGGDRLRQRLQQLFRQHDPVPVTHHGFERVIDGQCRIAEMLDLLQNRVRQAACEGIACNEENGQPVGHGDAGGRHHVQRPRPDRSRSDHDLPAPLCLGKADCGKRHGLFVLPAPGRQLVLHRLQSFGKASDVAVPKNGEHACEQWNALSVDLGKLVAQVTY
ncbi:hypothetical protein AGR7C_Lc100097 [Agrobacterium deltaense Zutra 3/1]|uniref:Uncharacterized protein n=1 Tax=Agrobacterium deltaense Zutra 3/1 TaxID=1183427 RepID=A0A1S7QRR9_9HYPH|nr:hypothetical protein AGR7C_Lc100097 [Agrobacterium deltaense Zutra 3/1]